MNSKEVDLKLKELFLNSIDSAYTFAVESRDVEALGGIATLAAKCIDWEKDKPDAPMGFRSLNAEEGDEDE